MKKMLFILVINFITITNAFSYKFTSDFTNGFYWQNFPVKFDIIGSTNSEGQQLQQMVDYAKKEWEAIVGSQVWDFSLGYTTSASRATNSIRWSNNFAAETGFDPSVTLAITTRYTNGTYVSKSDIILNGNSYQLRNDQGLLYRTILHEMGHVVGLDHTNAQAVMYPYITQFTTPQQDDIDGFNALIDETFSRQGTGYISPLSSEDLNNKYANCGSIDLSDKNGPSNFIGSLLFGLLFMLVLKQLLKLRLIKGNNFLKAQ